MEFSDVGTLYEEPTCDFSIKGSEYVISLGFIKPKVKVWNPIPKNTIQISEEYLKWDPLIAKVPLELNYVYARPTWAHVAKQIALFDHAPGVEGVPLDDDLQFNFEWAANQIVDWLGANKVYTTQISFEEIDWNLSASAGFKYSDVFGVKKKKDALKDPLVWKMLEDYWHSAHIEKYYPIWKVSPKVEYLKYNKFILEGSSRIFEIPPLHFLAYSHRLTQKFNKLLYAVPNSPIAVGINFAQGGFADLVRQLDSFYIKGMGDVTKWDKYFHHKLRKWCLYIRQKLIHPSYSPAKRRRIINRLIFIYQECVTSLTVTPWMQLLILLDYMKSGDPNTTPDNSLGHFVKWLSYARRYIPNVTIWNLIKFIIIKLYADDHLFGTTKRYAFLASFSRRKEFYASCGFLLKEEDDRVQESSRGLTFLGGTITECEGRVGPAYDLNRIWSSIVRRSDTVRLDYYFAKVRSLMILSTFHGRRVYEHIRSLVEFLRERLVNRGIVELVHLPEELVGDVLSFPGLFVPSFEYSLAWWSGEEASCFVNKMIDVVL